MKIHPYAEVFPLLDGERLEELAADIREHGLREKIWTYRGHVLDGRNRLLACQKARVKPEFRTFKGSDTEALALVVSANVQRRHLTESQRAMAAARIATLGVGANQHREGAARAAPSQSEAAAQLDVSTDSIQRARKVIDKGSKALQAAVEAGEVPVKRAAAVVDLPKSEQLAAAKAKPEKPSPPAPVEDWEPEDDEAQRIAAIEREQAAALDKLTSGNDALAAAVEEIKRQAAEIASLKLSRDGFQRGRAEAIRLLKAEQRKVDALQKKLTRAESEIEKLRERLAVMEEGA